MATAYVVKHVEAHEGPLRDTAAVCEATFPRAYTSRGFRVATSQRPLVFVISSRKVGGKQVYRLGYYFRATTFAARLAPRDRKGDLMFAGENDQDTKYFGDGISIDDDDLSSWLSTLRSAMPVPEEKAQSLMDVANRFIAK